MERIEAQERVLAVHAHADDVAWVCAGTVAKLAKTAPVDNLLFTDSNYEGIGDIRRMEEITAMAILGMSRFHPIGYEFGLKDGHHFGNRRLARSGARNAPSRCERRKGKIQIRREPPIG